MGCVVKTDGDIWDIDENHPAYPRERPSHPAADGKSFRKPTKTLLHSQEVGDAGRGPGTELKRILAGFPFFIKTTPNCRCNARAKQMDAWGIDGCLERFDVIVGWLAEEASRRKIPFVAAAGRAIVRRAIAAARRTADV
jgi:hypothetical protein